MSWVEAVWARNKAIASAKSYTDSSIAAIGTNMTYKGSVATVEDLPTSGQVKGDVYTITADGSEQVWTSTAWEQLGAVLPAVTSSDAGKFLRVNSSGAWVAETVPSAQGGSF